jgi:hypothetical protein
VIDLPPPPGYEQTVQAVVQCGIPYANIRIEYVDEFQSDVVTISDLGEISEGRLRCLKSAVHPFYILDIEDEGQRTAFYQFSRQEDRPQEKADAIEWLRSKGLSDRVPDFDPNEGLEQFAAAIETACGLEVGSALTPWGASYLTVRPEFVQRPDFDLAAEEIACLIRMFEASDAREHGVDFFFIGNGAVASEEKK